MSNRKPGRRCAMWERRPPLLQPYCLILQPSILSKACQVNELVTLFYKPCLACFSLNTKCNKVNVSDSHHKVQSWGCDGTLQDHSSSRHYCCNLETPFREEIKPLTRRCCVNMAGQHNTTQYIFNKHCHDTTDFILFFKNAVKGAQMLCNKII